MHPSVVKVDSHNGLDMYCYQSCDNTTPIEIASIRGVVLDGDNVVFKGFGYLPEYTVYDIEHVKNTYPNLAKYTFHESFEGTFIKVFYAKEKWYISTHRKLDAYKSKWGSSTSFGEQFEKGLPLPLSDFLSTLNTTYQYLFVVRSTRANRIVCKPPASSSSLIVHVGTFVDGCFKVDIDIGIPRSTSLSFDTFEEVFKHIEHIDHMRVQGLIMYTGDQQVKLINTQYKKLSQLRNNEANMSMRYIQIRNDVDTKQQFLKLFPEFNAEANQIESIIHQLAVTVYKMYVRRYIYKEFLPTTPTKHYLLKQCHMWHIADRTNNIMSLSTVYRVLNELPPQSIQKLISEPLE